MVRYAEDTTDERLRALSNATRREILRRVWRREISAGELAQGFDMSRPAVSQHIAVLLEAGLLADRRVGTRRLFRARRGPIRQVVYDLASVWESALDEIKATVERNAPDSDPHSDESH